MINTGNSARTMTVKFSKSSSGLSTGAIIGIVIPVSLVFLAVVIYLIFDYKNDFFLFKKKKKEVVIDNKLKVNPPKEDFPA